jgi:hypothetical protein
LLDAAPFAEALDKVLVLVDQLASDGIVLQHIDLGGGLGIRYRDEDAPKRQVLPAALAAKSLPGGNCASCSNRGAAWSATPASCSPASSI